MCGRYYLQRAVVQPFDGNEQGDFITDLYASCKCGFCDKWMEFSR